MLMERIILASASPRRAELLRAAGIEFDAMPANADETVHPGETPEAYVQRVAEAKATAVRHRANGRPVLAADTVVVVDEVILGKPVDREDAKRMLRMLSGRAHDVLTAVLLSRGPTPPSPQGGFGEPRGSAQVDKRIVLTYAIQGYASRFITRIDGSYSNVVGLPIALVYEMINSLER